MFVNYCSNSGGILFLVASYVGRKSMLINLNKQKNSFGIAMFKSYVSSNDMFTFKKLCAYPQYIKNYYESIRKKSLSKNGQVSEEEICMA